MCAGLISVAKFSDEQVAEAFEGLLNAGFLRKGPAVDDPNLQSYALTIAGQGVAMSALIRVTIEEGLEAVIRAHAYGEPVGGLSEEGEGR